MSTPTLHIPGEVYLVGGAVRDALLGLPVHERDWVVTGATPQAMLEAGFRPVGKDFPVFLHPHSGEEYALARTERKSGHGYAGFEFHTSPDVTLEQDLQRRDLSINAIAQAADGSLIDPWGGREDLDKRQLRAVSAHFVEDPLRVLRVARFRARFHAQGFELETATEALLHEIVASGELQHLVAERIWRETEKALMSAHPAEYFRLLRRIGALAVLFPELDRLYGVPQNAKYHPEVDSGIHAMLAIEQSAHISNDLATRFAVVCHDFGKGITPADVLPSHRGHEHRGVPLVKAFCQRLRVPKALEQSATAVTKLHLLCHQARELRPETLLKLFEQLDALRRPERVEMFVNACLADARGRTGFEQAHYPQADYLRHAFAALGEVSPATLIEQGLQGAALGKALRQARVERLARFKRAELPE